MPATSLSKSSQSHTRKLVSFLYNQKATWPLKMFHWIWSSVTLGISKLEKHLHKNLLVLFRYLWRLLTGCQICKWLSFLWLGQYRTDTQDWNSAQTCEFPPLFLECCVFVMSSGSLRPRMVLYPVFVPLCWAWCHLPWDYWDTQNCDIKIRQ